MREGDVESPLISVVVPIYNVADYLDACLVSLARQTYRNIEVILVDDGSTDGSREKCLDWEKRDCRFKAVRKANSGLSDARNMGVGYSSGDYISFVDGDDIVSPCFVEAMLTAAQQCGVAVSALAHGFPFFDGDELSEVESFRAKDALVGVRVEDAEHYIEKMLYQAYETGAPFRLYERQIVEKHPFPSGLLYEDTATTYKFVAEAGSVCVLKCGKLYAYRQRRNSIMHSSYAKKKTDSALMVTRQLYDDITDSFPRLQSAAASRCFSVCRQVYSQTPSDKAADRDALWREMVKHRSTVLRDPKARRRERLATAISLVGKRAFSAFCAIYRKMGYSA